MSHEREYRDDAEGPLENEDGPLEISPPALRACSAQETKTATRWETQMLWGTPMFGHVTAQDALDVTGKYRDKSMRPEILTATMKGLSKNPRLRHERVLITDD